MKFEWLNYCLGMSAILIGGALNVASAASISHRGATNWRRLWPSRKETTRAEYAAMAAGVYLSLFGIVLMVLPIVLARD